MSVVVMVPVPADLVDDVQKFLFQLNMRAGAPQWNHEAMGEHLATLGEEARAVICAVADGVIEGNAVEDTALAARLGVSVRELYGLVMEANDVTVGSFGGNIIFARRDTEAENEGTGAERPARRLQMLKGYAVMVRDRARELGLRPAIVATP